MGDSVQGIEIPPADRTPSLQNPSSEIIAQRLLISSLVCRASTIVEYDVSNYSANQVRHTDALRLDDLR